MRGAGGLYRKGGKRGAVRLPKILVLGEGEKGWAGLPAEPRRPAEHVLELRLRVKPLLLAVAPAHLRHHPSHDVPRKMHVCRAAAMNFGLTTHTAMRPNYSVFGARDQNLIATCLGQGQNSVLKTHAHTSRSPRRARYGPRPHRVRASTEYY